MTATINASTSSGVIVTSDTSGALALQTANTTAMTINSSQVVNFANSPTVAGSALGSGTVNSGTAYQLAYYASTGTAVSTLGSLGTSGQVLTSGGASVAPSWSTPSAGAMTLISTQTASSSSDLHWTGLSGYDKYLLVINSISLGYNLGASLIMRFGTGSGPTYITSGYSAELLDIYSGGTVSGFGSSSYIMVSGYQGVYSPSAISANIQLSGFNNTSAYPSFQSIASYQTGSQAQALDVAAGVYLSTGNIITALKIYSTSGTIISGSASLYGITS